MVLLRTIECFGHVRHFGDHVDSNYIVCLWIKKCLDSLVMARMESSFHHDILRYMAEEIGSNDRCRMDHDKIWR